MMDAIRKISALLLKLLLCYAVLLPVCVDSKRVKEEATNLDWRICLRIERSTLISIYNLSSCHITEFPDLSKLPKFLDRASILDLSNNNLYTIPQQQWKYLSNVSELYLQHNKFTAFEDGTFANAMELRFLDVSYNFFTEWNETLTSHLRELELVNVSFNKRNDNYEQRENSFVNSIGIYIWLGALFLFTIIMAAIIKGAMIIYYRKKNKPLPTSDRVASDLETTPATRATVTGRESRRTNLWVRFINLWSRQNNNTIKEINYNNETQTVSFSGESEV